MANKKAKQTVKRGGLNPLPQDKHPLKLGAFIANLPDPKTIPDFTLEGGWAEEGEQENDDCSAWAVVGALELLFNVRFSRKFQFAMSKARSGDPDEWGQNLDDAMMTPVKYGALRIEDEPKEIKDAPLLFTRRIENWPDIKELLVKASPYKVKGMVSVEGQHDAFDDAISSMYYFLQKGEKRAVVFGTLVDFGVDQEYVTGPLSGNYGHAMFGKGKRMRVSLLTSNGIYDARVQNSWSGRGIHYFDRERYNASAKMYNHFMFVPYTKEEMEWSAENGVRLDDSMIKSIFIPMYNALVDFYRKLFDLMQAGGPPPFPIKIERLAQLISKYEGTLPWHRSIRNNNAGNCRFFNGGYLSIYGNVREDRKGVSADQNGFAIFPTKEQGDLYLRRMLHNWAKTWKAEWTVFELMAGKLNLKTKKREGGYAPESDKNDSTRYSKWLADGLGVDPNLTKLKDLLV